MNVSIVGMGFAGLVTGVCLAKKGHDVICVDKRAGLIRKVNNMECPIYEPKLSTLLMDTVKEKKLIATSDLEFAVNNTEITIITVDTPAKDGCLDLSYLESWVKDVGNILEEKESYHVVCISCAIVPSTTDSLIKEILEQTSQKQAGSFGLVMCPVFLRESSAVEDFMSPERVIIGAFDDRSFDTMAELYENYFNAPILKTNLRTAEMIKFASCSLFEMLMSFGNELSNICEGIGDIDAIDVFNGLIMDRRIAIRNKTKFILPGLVQYFRPGSGFGGSSFSKNITAMVSRLKQTEIHPHILEAALEVNQNQALKMVSKLENILGDIKDKKIAVLGVAYKENTDEIRESPAIKIIYELLAKGAIVCATDPQAIPNARRELGEKEGLKLLKNCRDALKDADGALLVTAWSDYKKLKPKDFARLMKRAVIIDGRRIYDKDEMESLDIIYAGIGTN